MGKGKLSKVYCNFKLKGIWRFQSKIWRLSDSFKLLWFISFFKWLLRYAACNLVLRASIKSELMLLFHSERKWNDLSYSWCIFSDKNLVLAETVVTQLFKLQSSIFASLNIQCHLYRTRNSHSLSIKFHSKPYWAKILTTYVCLWACFALVLPTTGLSSRAKMLLCFEFNRNSLRILCSYNNKDTITPQDASLQNSGEY